MKYVVLGCYKSESEVYYAITSEDNSDPEVLREKDLSLLLTMSMKMYDSEGDPIMLSDGKIVGCIPDVTSQLDEEDEDEVDDFYEAYGEDAVEWGSSEDLDEEEESDDPYEGFGDDDEEEETCDLDEEEDDGDFWESYEDEVGGDEIDDYYAAWSKDSTVLPVGQQEIESRKLNKDFSALDSSTESKLYTHLTDNQKKLLQEYYLYISKRIFNLERGVNNLPIRRKEDLNAIRNTGDSWVYAGFIDMGYAGTSVCPYCGKSLGLTALSACHQAPVVRWSVPRGKKTTGQEAKLMRTYNGVCSYPGCRNHCSVVTDEVGVRKINRDNQYGIFCESCGNAIPQSSHYCTFNDPVRYMHVAWDVSISDLDTNFYGQMVSSDLEALIDSNNCIKFGLTCTAEFFDIAKDSAAFKALENVQNVCKKDMELLQEEYEKGDANRKRIAQSFPFLDAIVDKLVILASKTALLKGEELLPGRLLLLYKEMRKEEMIVPKSFIQFIRDLLVDWDTHKFIDLSKNFPLLRNSVGSLAGAKTGTPDERGCFERLGVVLNGAFGKRANAICKLIEPFASGKGRYASVRYSYRAIASTCYRCLDYIVAMFIYKLCGYYEYDAVNQGDEGGKDVTKSTGFGKHATDLKYFYSGIARALPFDIEYTYDYTLKILDTVDLLQRLEEGLKLELATKRLGVRTAKTKDGRDYKVYFIDDFDPNNPKSVVYPCNVFDNGKLKRIVQDRGKEVIYDLNRSNSLANWVEATSETVSYLEEAAFRFPKFEIEYLTAEMNIRNEKELARVAPKEEEAGGLEIPDLFNEQEESEESEESKESVPTPGAKTVDEVMQFLKSADLSGYTDRKWDFPVKLVKQLKKSGGTPSDKQFYYIKPLYEEVSGKVYVGVSASGDLSNEMKKAIDYVLSNRSVADDFTCSVLETVKGRGKASPKQMRYVDKAVKAYRQVIGV